jgi:hypothetical protein
MPNTINAIDHPICLATPERLAPSAWLEHTPFAMWLTSALRPNTLVELGTHYGTSYCAFCQAIQAVGLPTRAFAVDTWEGDRHSGGYTHEVLDDLRVHHDPRYARFSALLRMTFDEALPRFANGEIDLLHIDGYHTYEAARHDFEAWRPKMSDRGIVLLHDIKERRDDFGVWRLWEELASRYPSFAFLHEHGLGVLALGADIPADVRKLLDLRGADIEPVRTLFHEMGRRLRIASILDTGLSERDAARAERDAYRTERDAYRAERDAYSVEREIYRAERDTYRTELDACRAERDACRAERDACRAERDACRAERDRFRSEVDVARAELAQWPRILSSLRAAEERLTNVQREWDQLRSSQSWRAFHQLARLAARIGPEGSRRRRALKRVARLVETIAREGTIGFERRQFKQGIDRSAKRRDRGATADDPVGDGPAVLGAAPGSTSFSHKQAPRAPVH